ncbi:MAG: prolyl oligopeptidase family serine peptidase [Anaerolineales bacterium]|nr:prolyl oligopeptidase family serine peptidase [Anaerolineales bacterium]
MRFRLLTLLCLLSLAVACANQPPPSPIPTVAPLAQLPTVTATTTPGQTATATASATASPTLTLTSTSTATATASPTATLTPSATPNPYLDYTIDALAARQYGGGELEVVDLLHETETWKRYLIRYPSDGLQIYGFLSVPNEGYKFPVAIVVHGYITPSDYKVEAYTTRYTDALVEAGYLVIHPNLRNFPPSDEGDITFRVGYANDILNLTAIILEQSQISTSSLRRADANQIHIMGHSLGGGAALRAITVWPEPFRAAVLYGSMSGDEQQNYEQIQQWTDGALGDFELLASPEMLAAISPADHLDRIQAAVSIHHSYEDTVVPPRWSEQTCNQLQNLGHPVECFFYNLQPHTFRGDGDALFMARMIAFFDYW